MTTYVVVPQQVSDELAAGARGGVARGRRGQVRVRILVGRRPQVVDDAPHPCLVAAIAQVQHGRTVAFL